MIQPTCVCTDGLRKVFKRDMYCWANKNCQVMNGPNKLRESQPDSSIADNPLVTVTRGKVIHHY